jgi:signal transduction histidine kinase
MTAYFAHELRNPLGAIDSALNAMPDELPESAKRFDISNAAVH